MNKWVWTAAGLGALAVALGAFGAHGLRSKVSAADLEIWKTAAHYHLIHAVLLFAIAQKEEFRWAKRLLLTGILIFGSTLYLLVLTQVKILGAITPLGGLSLIAGWIALGVESGRLSRRS